LNGSQVAAAKQVYREGIVMNENASAVAAGGRINHFKVVVLALAASALIMLIGITARTTDDVDGYGVGAAGASAVVYQGVAPRAR
jgi:hypothetical protein